MLPTFLVIGAMKAGSTTLYHDLNAQPQIFLPDKDFGYFNQADIVTARGRARYEAQFRPATPEQVRGDVSATYAMLPDEGAGVAERAAEVLGTDFAVIYTVRDPVDRAVSQHYHELSKRTISEASVDAAVRTVPRLIDYSRYAFQIRPWVEAVGPANVRIVQHEDYRDDRGGGLAALLDFVGAGPVLDTATFDAVYNVGDTKQVTVGVGRRLTQSSAYRRYVRPLLPARVRRRGRGAILHAVPPRPAPPSLDTVDLILDAIRPDLAELHTLGLKLPPLWDLDATRERYAAKVSG